MARPIENTTYDVLYKSENLMVNMKPKDHKHTLGQKMFELALEMYKDISIASDSLEDRKPSLTHYRGCLRAYVGLLKLCNDKGLIFDKMYVDLIEQCNSLDVQSRAILKSMKKDAGVSASSCTE